MGRLHGGDDAELRHALEILHPSHLGVLQPETRVRLA
jgi:hypothetical protein